MPCKILRYMLLIFPVICMIGRALVWPAALESSSEENIKAAYLFNFAKFVEWPDGVFSTEHDSIQICVIGDDILSETLELLEKKVVAGRTIEVRHGNEIIPGKRCNIVYIGESYQQNVENVLDTYRGKPVLTVSSIKDFAERGGMIGFVRKGNLVRFKVNRRVVSESGLSISSRLLKLALIIDDGKERQ